MPHDSQVGGKIHKKGLISTLAVTMTAWNKFKSFIKSKYYWERIFIHIVKQESYEKFLKIMK